MYGLVSVEVTEKNLQNKYELVVQAQAKSNPLKKALIIYYKNRDPCEVDPMELQFAKNIFQFFTTFQSVLHRLFQLS